MAVLLEIKDLSIHFIMKHGTVRAVNGVTLSLQEGETLGLVGETGAGKTTTALGIMRLIQSPPGRIVSGEIIFNGKDLLHASTREMQKIRGGEISMIFQDPMTSLNPIDTVGAQIAEVIRLHDRCAPSEAEEKAKQMLELVGIDGSRYKDYPHQFSGGMKQRVVIAIALACDPRLLIADEPTTALDVTIQAQVMDLMIELKQKLNTAMLLITHDLGVVSEVCDKVAIMYAGEIVEFGTLEQIFHRPMHPYTQGLFASLPNMRKKVHRLTPIDGMMPDPINLPEGCKFAPRCPHASAACEADPAVCHPEEGHMVKCVLLQKKEVSHE